MANKPRDDSPPRPDEQSGSTGRDPGPPRKNPGVDGKPGTGDNTGQGNYGQSGYGEGGFGKGDAERSSYQKDVPGRLDPGSPDSNRGSGSADPARHSPRDPAAKPKDET
jgi:hypothetical protein